MALNILSDDKRKSYVEYIKKTPPFPDPEECGYYMLDGPFERQMATMCRDALKEDCIARNVPFDYEIAPSPPEDYL